MIAFEALFTFLTAIAFITLIGRPLAKAYSEKVQSLPHAMTGAEQKKLLERVSALEFELSEMKRNVVALQESSDFAIKMLEDKNGESLKESPKLNAKSDVAPANQPKLNK